MPDELPPNKVCPKCGAENLATASHCLECHAPLRPGLGLREEVLWIDGKSAARRPLPLRDRSGWRGFFRLMSVPGCTALVYALYPDFDGKGPAAIVTFIAAASLAIVAAVATDTPRHGRTTHHVGWATVDGLLRGIGCLFSAMVALGVSFFAFFFAMCYCGSR